MDIGQPKRYYIIDTLTSGESGIDATINGIVYTLLKTEIDAAEPTGTIVNELDLEEFKACLSLNGFTPICLNIRDYKYKDKEFCSDLVLEFQSDTGSLDLATTEALESLLSEVLVKLNINSPHHALTKLNLVPVSALFPQEVKDKYVNLLQNFLNKYPR